MNLPSSDCWNVDAVAPHGWNFEDFRSKMIHETPEIEEFLATPSTHRFIISAPKGFGKSLLLIAKRMQIGQQPDYRIVTTGEVVDRPGGGLRELSKEKLSEFSSDYDRWTRIWSVSIMIAVIKDESHPSIDSWLAQENCDPWTRKILQDRTIHSAANIFTSLLDVDRTIRENVLLSENFLARCFSSIRSQTALFIDNVDQFFNPLLEDHNIHLSGKKDALGRHKSNQIWKFAQLGLAKAAYRLHNQNNHVKVFCTIRREALSGLEGGDADQGQILGRTIEIEYRSGDLRDIFIKNIRLTKKLFKPLTDDEIDGPMSEFFGSCYASMMHTILDQTESAFDFVLRHTFYRPRDLMMIGHKISLLDIFTNGTKKNEQEANKRTEGRIKEIVRERSDEIVKCLRDEMMNFFAMPDFNLLFPLMRYNIFKEDQARNIEANYVKSLNDAGIFLNAGDEGTRPLLALYEAGMLGLVRTEESGATVQQFVTPREVKIALSTEMPQTKEYYLVHSALDHLIDKAVGDVYFQNFDNNNIIGNDRPWREPHSSLFACRGDICHFSRIMDSEFYRVALDKIYRWVSSTCQNLVYFEVSGGDSILLIDRSPARLVKAVDRLTKMAEEDAELPLKFRFGGAAGPVSFRTFTQKEDGKPHDRKVPMGLALRTSSRLEPFAPEGKFIVDEHFKRLDRSSRLDFVEMSKSDIPLHYNDETSKFRVQKNLSDPAHETKIFSVALIPNDEFESQDLI